jgi:hypothetical protein
MKVDSTSHVGNLTGGKKLWDRNACHQDHKANWCGDYYYPELGTVKEEHSEEVRCNITGLSEAELVEFRCNIGSDGGASGSTGWSS